MTPKECHFRAIQDCFKPYSSPTPKRYIVAVQDTFELFCFLEYLRGYLGLAISLNGAHRHWEKYFDMAFNNWEFITIGLTPADVTPLGKYQAELAKSDDSPILKLLVAGYKVSLAWVDDKAAFICTLSPTKACPYNKGCSLSSWSEDVEEAVAMSCYKTFVLAPDMDWKNSDRSRGAWG